jgi:hypothetical protein
MSHGSRVVDVSSDLPKRYDRNRSWKFATHPVEWLPGRIDGMCGFIRRPVPHRSALHYKDPGGAAWDALR